MPGRQPARPALRRSVRVEEIMGTAVSIHVINATGTLNAAAQRAIEGCFAELREIDRVFSTYRTTPTSPSSRAASSIWPAQTRASPRCARHAGQPSGRPAGCSPPT